MRSSIWLFGSAAAACLWAEPAAALSPETTCENIKLRATGAYARCLSRAAAKANAHAALLSESAIERCDTRFDRAFEEAEAGGACRTAGGPTSLRGPIQDQTEATLAAVTSGPGCPSQPVFNADTEHYWCLLTTGSAVDLAAIVAQIGDPKVTNDTVVWIEAWGASGAHGNTGAGGAGASGGYAQMTTTVGGLIDFFGTSEIYYYLGVNGAGPTANDGGDGGTGTIITGNDLTKGAASLGETLLIAGGGGGGGAGREKESSCGDSEVSGGDGGKGGEAISTLQTDDFKAGAMGSNSRSGDGGGGDAAGTGGIVDSVGTPQVGGDGIAVIGGVGGGRSDSDASTGFFNQSSAAKNIPAAGGHGGHPGDDAGGGGGGGGYGGGGGGTEGFTGSGCISGGGGGGGSFALASTESCPRASGSNPNGIRGAVRIVLDAGSCS